MNRTLLALPLISFFFLVPVSGTNAHPFFTKNHIKEAVATERIALLRPNIRTHLTEVLSSPEAQTRGFIKALGPFFRGEKSRLEDVITYRIRMYKKGNRKAGDLAAEIALIIRKNPTFQKKIFPWKRILKITALTGLAAATFFGAYLAYKRVFREPPVTREPAPIKRDALSLENMIPRIMIVAAQEPNHNTALKLLPILKPLLLPSGGENVLGAVLGAKTGALGKFFALEKALSENIKTLLKHTGTDPARKEAFMKWAQTFKNSEEYGQADKKLRERGMISLASSIEDLLNEPEKLGFYGSSVFISPLNDLIKKIFEDRNQDRPDGNDASEQTSTTALNDEQPRTWSGWLS